jgi:hypothetical protein
MISHCSGIFQLWIKNLLFRQDTRAFAELRGASAEHSAITDSLLARTMEWFQYPFLPL